MKTLIVGDVCPKTETVNDLFKKGDIKTLFGDAVQLFEGNDINFINLECALTESDNVIEKFGPNLKACAETAQVLKNVGVTVCGLSNNHIFDFGIPGYRDTVAALDDAGLDYTGFGDNYEDSRKNYVVEKDGEKVCIIAVCEHEYSYALDDRMGSRPFDPYDTAADVRAAKAMYDRVIVVYHGAKEHCRYPSPRMVKLARAMVDNGADVFVGQHSHCIGCYEKYNNGHILYGQGNFHFVWPNVSEGWNSCLALKYDTKTNEIEFIPVVTGENGIALAKGEEKESILALFEELCTSMLDGSWKKGWNEFCEKAAPTYINVIANAYAPGCAERAIKIFGHFLDCEAHSDVWYELNKTANHTNEK